MADYSLVPVDYQPEFDGVSLVPVDHDPFADDTSQPALMQPQPATSQSTANNAQPVYPPEIVPPLIGDGGQFSSGVPIFNKAADLASKVAYGMMQRFATIPQRLVESNALDMQHLGEDGYEPQSIGPAVEAAMLMAGAGLPMAERGAVGAFGGKLPPLDSAGSVADKLDRYLLDPDHYKGGPKANWFEQALGFTREDASDLAKQLVFDESQAVKKGVNEYGTIFNQTINVTGANGRIIPLTTGWIIGPDGVPRLTTAFPGR